MCSTEIGTYSALAGRSSASLGNSQLRPGVVGVGPPFLESSDLAIGAEGEDVDDWTGDGLACRLHRVALLAGSHDRVALGRDRGHLALRDLDVLADDAAEGPDAV